jgi:hypothetical protein
LIRLYVWEDVLTDYTSGVMFAMAESVDEARRLVRESGLPAYNTEVDEEPDVYDSPVGFHLYGGG